MLEEGRETKKKRGMYNNLLFHKAIRRCKSYLKILLHFFKLIIILTIVYLNINAFLLLARTSRRSFEITFTIEQSAIILHFFRDTKAISFDTSETNVSNETNTIREH